MQRAPSDKRIFPRTDTECPVLYALGTSKKWQVAILKNLSATGMLIKTKEKLVDQISITLMTKPATNRLVPEIIAKGKVTRCKKITEDEYEVSCKLTEVKSQPKTRS